ncbi:hypothetical protein QJQ45_020594 [Haematococcus lacustris]|nr:hypothetical protein QJQ45_020594 [Haematococcus lacustris]
MATQKRITREQTLPQKGQSHVGRVTAVQGQQQREAVGVWQCRLQVASGCRCAAVHEQQQQAAVHVFECMSSNSSRL